jgi:hypothetical protein
MTRTFIGVLWPFSQGFNVVVLVKTTPRCLGMRPVAFHFCGTSSACSGYTLQGNMQQALRHQPLQGATPQTKEISTHPFPSSSSVLHNNLQHHGSAPPVLRHSQSQQPLPHCSRCTQPMALLTHRRATMSKYNAHPECFWKSGWTQKGAEVGEFEAGQLLGSETEAERR